MLSVGLLFFGMDSPRAEAVFPPWPDLLGFTYKEVLEEARKTVIDAAVEAAKKTVLAEVNAQMNSEIGGSGGSGSPKFIVDWRDSLQAQPEKATTIQMQNLFTSMGKGAGSTASDGSASYVSGMLSGAKKSVLDSSIPEVINMAEYGVDNPAEVFNGKNMRAFLTAFGSTSKIGNKIEATLYAQDQKNKFAETNRRIAETQAMANGGFLPTLSNGQVITPGATIRDLLASANNMNFAKLASASTIQQVTSALVTRLVSNTVSKGIGEAKAYVKTTYGSQIDALNTAYSTANGLKASFGDLSVGSTTGSGVNANNCSGNCRSSCALGETQSTNLSEYCGTSGYVCCVITQ